MSTSKVPPQSRENSDSVMQCIFLSIKYYKHMVNQKKSFFPSAHHPKHLAWAGLFLIEAENKSLSLSTQITSAVSPGHSASAAQRQTDPPVRQPL